MMNWMEFGAGAASAIGVGIILAAVREHFAREQRRMYRQLEIAEMVGAVRSELTGVVKRIDALSAKLDEHTAQCDSRCRAMLADFHSNPTHN